ncbi:MAG: MFS transporter [Chloroflexi bacterium]|nr:MFS transporter [Chloroflexota bacterium]
MRAGDTIGSILSERNKTVLAIYLAGFLQGISLILFPAAGPLFTDAELHRLSSAQFGLLFMPQIIGAIVASALAARLGLHFGMKRVLLAGLACDLLAMLLLAASHLLIGPGNAAFAVLLLATGAVGVGFGFAITALNAYAFELFPGRRDAAVTGLHVLTGIGQVSAPQVLGLFTESGFWWGAAMAIGAGLTLMIIFQLGLPLLLSSEKIPADKPRAPQHLPGRVWLYAAVVFLYGVCEATFGNWSPIYLEQDAGLSMADTTRALSLFWAAVTIGRVLFAMAAIRTNARLVYALSPLIVGAALFALPSVKGVAPSMGVLAAAGLGLSFFFPYSISLASSENPHLAPAVSGVLVAAIMVGTGVSANLIGLIRDFLGLSSIFRLFSIYAGAMALIAAYLGLVQPKLKERV